MAKPVTGYWLYYYFLFFQIISIRFLVVTVTDRLNYLTRRGPSRLAFGAIFETCKNDDDFESNKYLLLFFFAFSSQICMRCGSTYCLTAPIYIKCVGTCYIKLWYPRYCGNVQEYLYRKTKQKRFRNIYFVFIIQSSFYTHFYEINHITVAADEDIPK